MLYDTVKKPGSAPSSISGTGSLDDFARLKVYGSTGEWRRCYVELYKTGTGYNNTEFSMSAYNGDSSNAWMKMAAFKVTQGSATWSISPTSVMETHFSSAGVALATSYGPSIVRVVGVREPVLAVG